MTSVSSTSVNVGHTFDIGAWLRRTEATPHLFTRDVAKRCRGAIEAALEASDEGAVLTLDCSSVETIDYTGADECLVKLMRSVQGEEYGERFLILSGVMPQQESNLLVAFERAKCAIVIQRSDGPHVLGSLWPYLQRGWNFVAAEGPCTALDYAHASGQGVSLAGTVMTKLHHARLVQRVVQSTSHGGREYLYRVVCGDQR